MSSMKKEWLKALAVTALLVAMPVQVMAGPSIGTNEDIYVPSGSGSGADTITVSPDGVKTTEATTSSGANGSSVGVAVDTVTSTGLQVTVNSKGEAVIGDTAVTFANGSAATAGLPEAAVAVIDSINGGQALNTVVTDVDMTGYNALTGTHAIVTKNAATAEVKTGNVEVTLYVPNLVEGLSNVSVLFYDNATGRWTLLPVVKTDLAAKTVSVNVPGSGTLSVVYKR